MVDENRNILFKKRVEVFDIFKTFIHALSGKRRGYISAIAIPKVMSENTVNSAYVMGYDTKTEVCGHGFRTGGAWCAK
ncbi:hypothetical protein KCP73_08960 [Salmonella enterica subsp. enterica]|nr:hypothetical protein KCP73_08960 [Salmonella enterica subsp. enterica]